MKFLKYEINTVTDNKRSYIIRSQHFWFNLLTFIYLSTVANFNIDINNGNWFTSKTGTMQ